MDQKKVFILGLCTYSVLFIFSILFYKERTVFLDIAYHLFYILKDGGFAIQNNRFGAAITQLFPLAGSKMGLSINHIARLYSVGFILFYGTAFVIICQVIKNTKIALVFLVFSILMTTHTFYWIQSELPQGATFLFIFLAVFDNVLKGTTIPAYFNWISSSLLFIVCFTHPLLLFACLFAFLFFYLNYPPNRKLVLSTAVTYLTFYFIKALFFKTSYDTQAMGGLKNIFLLFPHYFNIQSNKNFLKYLLHDYYFLPILLVLVGIIYIKQKKHMKLGLMLCFFLGYIFIVNISNPSGADQFYLENQYLILSIFVGMPFVFDYLPTIKNKQIPIVIVSTIAIVGVIRICNAHQFYTRRLEWNRNLLYQTSLEPQKKLILSITKVPKDKLLMTWASSYEFWLLSTLEQGISRSIIVEETPNEFDWALNKNKSFIAKWGVFDYSTLDNRYFKFIDTTFYLKK
jgi:hypothetical protein